MADDTPKKIMTPLATLNAQPERPAAGFRVDIRDISSTIEVVSVIPSATPRGFYESVKIYKSGGTKRLYVFAAGVGWLYTTLT